MQDAADHRMALWDIQANKTIHVFGQHHIVYASFVDNDRYIATIDPNEEIEYTLWNGSTYERILTSDIGNGQGPLDARFSPDGKYFIAQGTLWNALTGRPIQSSGGIFTPDSQSLLLRDNRVTVMYCVYGIHLAVENYILPVSNTG
jgi:WD40 repeat protein